MSNTYTTTSTFSTYNFTGNLSLTGYCLPISKFTFEASTDVYKNGLLLWDFGDNTTGSGLTATHSYDFPGSYTVTNYFYDSGGQVYLNTFSSTVSVTNFVTDFIYLSTVVSDDCLSTNSYVCITSGDPAATILLITPTANNYILNISKIENPVTLIRTNSWQTWPALSATGYTINCFSSGGLPNFFDQGLNKNKYGHLYPYSSFYTKENNIFVETKQVQTPNNFLYCTISGAEIVLCDPSIPGSIFCGTKGVKDVYFKHDLNATAVNLLFQFDSKTYNDRIGQQNNTLTNSKNYFGYLNTFAVGVKARVQKNYDLSAFRVTSNGIAGDGVNSPTFNIDVNKFVNMPINFVVTLKDIDGFNIKDNPLLTIDGTNNVNSISIVPLDGNGNTVPGIIKSNFGNLSSLTTGGFYKGQFIPKAPANNVTLAVSGIVGVKNLYTPLLYGNSNTFNIYPSSGKYTLAKVNENYDFAQTLKDLRFQEFLLDDNILFDEFLTTIYGNISADAFSLGKVAYEKIANFVANQANVEKSSVESLFALNNLIGADISKFEQSNFRFPAKFKRIIDLLSVSHSRLWGTRNKFNINLNPRYGTDNTKFALNLGNELNIATTTLTAQDGFIVAQEKYSGEYRLCNTFIASAFIADPIYFLPPECIADETSVCLATESYNLTAVDPDSFVLIDEFPAFTGVYKLSNYSSDWGWPLVTADVQGIDVGKYYRFYEYKPAIDNTLVNSVLNFDDVTNTINESVSGYSDWINDNGIVDNIINYSLYTGVKLISAT